MHWARPSSSVSAGCWPEEGLVFYEVFHIADCEPRCPIYYLWESFHTSFERDSACFCQPPGDAAGLDPLRGHNSGCKDVWGPVWGFKFSGRELLFLWVTQPGKGGAHGGTQICFSQGLDSKFLAKGCANHSRRWTLAHDHHSSLFWYMKFYWNIAAPMGTRIICGSWATVAALNAAVEVRVFKNGKYRLWSFTGKVC